jgi:sulfur carrier protein
MDIMLNGEQRQVGLGSSVQDLLLALELINRRVAVEVNGEVVPRSAHGELRLQPGDEVEIVHAIGGG